MRILRIVGSATLWLAALLGLAAGGVWFAGRLGHIQPMIVVSGSMEPGIDTGDLLIDRRVSTAEIGVGDVVTVPSKLTGDLVTHRVIAIQPADEQTATNNTGEHQWELRLHGDANAEPDLETYRVGDEVWTPWIRVPQGGKVVSKMMEPAVAIPIIVALVALLGISLMDGQPRKVVRRVVRRMRLDPRVDELDGELASVGIDVDHLRTMSDLDLQLYALGIDLDTAEPSRDERDPSPLGFASSRRTADVDIAESSRRDERDPSPLGFGSSRGEVEEDDNDVWDFQLPPSDAIHQVWPPGRDRSIESEFAEREHEQPLASLTG